MARASRMLGLDCSEVIRSIKISKLPVEVKQAYVDAGLADNQAAMLSVAAGQSLDAQLTAVRSERERAEKPRKSKADRDVAREAPASPGGGHPSTVPIPGPTKGLRWSRGWKAAPRNR